MKHKIQKNRRDYYYNRSCIIIYKKQLSKLIQRKKAHRTNNQPMKYIFRYSLLSNFPNKDNTITGEELMEALRSVKFQFDKFEIDYLEGLCKSCVERILTRSQDKVVTVIEDVFGNGNKPVPELNAKDLQSIWQQQKVNVYKSILSDSCNSSYTFKEMQWSVKNVIMGRGQSSLSGMKGNNIMTRIKVNCISNNNSTQRVSMTINASRSGFQRMYNSLVQCQNAINQILLSEE